MSGKRLKIDVPTVIAGALTLVAGFAWNDAAKAGIQALYPKPDEDSFYATVAYATIVTIIIIFVFWAINTARSEIDAAEGPAKPAAKSPANPAGR